MDLLDSVKYEEKEVDARIAQAYRAVFGDTKEARIVLDDLMRECCWGLYSNDPDLQREITISQKPLWRIKAMMNGRPTEQEQEIETDE